MFGFVRTDIRTETHVKMNNTEIPETTKDQNTRRKDKNLTKNVYLLFRNRCKPRINTTKMSGDRYNHTKLKLSTV